MVGRGGRSAYIQFRPTALPVLPAALPAGLPERVRVFQNSDPNEWGSHPGSSTPVSPVLALVGFVGLCLLVGAAAGSLVAGLPRAWYLSLHAPPGTPPDWVFAPVWTGLYVLIGLAGWLAWRRASVA